MKFYFSRTLILSCVLCLMSVICSAQSWVWAKGEGGIGNDASNAVTVDTYGNTYITGNIAGKADFSGTVYQGNGIYEMYIAKYDPSGNLLWVKLAGGAGNDQGNSIKWKNGFVYVCGTFEDTALFETTALISKGQADIFLAKYNDSGNLIWVKNAGGTGLDYASSLDLDNDGNIYVAGSYESSINIGGNILTTTNVYKESFYAQYNQNGNVIWAKSTKGNNSNLITGITCDNNQALYLTGYFGANFKIGNASVDAISSSYDIFLAKVSTGDGSPHWLKRAGSTYEDGAHAVCCDKDGNPTIAGYFAGTAYFDNNTVTYSDYNDVFVAHYDTAGNNLWVRAGRGNKLDVAFSIAADNNGNVFATGMFQNQIDFDGNTLTAPDILDRDIFLISYDKNGNIRWLTKAGYQDTDCGLSVAVHANGTIALSGYYLHTCFFGTIALDYASGNDLFVAKYNPPVVSSIENAEDDEFNVSVYPNPIIANSKFEIRNSKFEKTELKIYNVTGEVIYAAHCPLPTAYFSLPTANYPAGIYFLQITAGNKTKVLKLVKE